MPRIHQLSLQVSKFIFLDEGGRLFVEYDGLGAEDAKRRGLAPVLVYGILVPQAAVRYMELHPQDEAESLGRFLLRAWDLDKAPLGVPDEVVVNAKLAENLPESHRLLSHCGATLRIADSRDKSYNRGLSAAQADARGRIGFLSSDPNGGLAEFNAEAWGRCRSDADHTWRARNRSAWEGYTQHPRRHLTEGERALLSKAACVPRPGQWQSYGQGALPPILYAEDAEILDPKTFDASAVCRLLTACGPESDVSVALAAGITTAELRLFFRKERPLFQNNLLQLCEHLRVSTEPVLLYPGGPTEPLYQPMGAYAVFVSRPRAAERLYAALGGGDSELSFEPVPEGLPPDPGWRYVLFRSFRGALQIMAFPREGAAAALLENGKLYGFAGTFPVSAGLYRDVVQTVARAAKDPEFSRSCGKGLWSRHWAELSVERKAPVPDYAAIFAAARRQAWPPRRKKS